MAAIDSDDDDEFYIVRNQSFESDVLVRTSSSEIDPSDKMKSLNNFLDNSHYIFEPFLTYIFEELKNIQYSVKKTKNINFSHVTISQKTNSIIEYLGLSKIVVTQNIEILDCYLKGGIAYRLLDDIFVGSKSWKNIARTGDYDFQINIDKRSQDLFEIINPADRPTVDGIAIDKSVGVYINHINRELNSKYIDSFSNIMSNGQNLIQNVNNYIDKYQHFNNDADYNIGSNKLLNYSIENKLKYVILNLQNINAMSNMDNIKILITKIISNDRDTYFNQINAIHNKHNDNSIYNKMLDHIKYIKKQTLENPLYTNPNIQNVFDDIYNDAQPYYMNLFDKQYNNDDDIDHLVNFILNINIALNSTYETINTVFNEIDLGYSINRFNKSFIERTTLQSFGFPYNIPASILSIYNNIFPFISGFLEIHNIYKNNGSLMTLANYTNIHADYDIHLKIKSNIYQNDQVKGENKYFNIGNPYFLANILSWSVPTSNERNIKILSNVQLTKFVGEYYVLADGTHILKDIIVNHFFEYIIVPNDEINLHLYNGLTNNNGIPINNDDLFDVTQNYGAGLIPPTVYNPHKNILAITYGNQYLQMINVKDILQEQLFTLIQRLYGGKSKKASKDIERCTLLCNTLLPKLKQFISVGDQKDITTYCIYFNNDKKLKRKIHDLIGVQQLGGKNKSVNYLQKYNKYKKKYIYLKNQITK
jgi:hypothetical protein